MAERITFKTQTVNKLLQEHFTDKKTKLGGDALKLMVEFFRVFVAEGAARAGHQAKTESAITVEIEHLEKILPQLMTMDDSKEQTSKELRINIIL